MAAVTDALVAPKKTILLAGVGLKLVPTMVTVVPIVPYVGVNEVIVGRGVITVKFVGLTEVKPFTVTVMTPVVEPNGTVVVMLVAVLTVTLVRVPLKATKLLAGMGSKSNPVIVTVVPNVPEVGKKEAMFVTVKFAEPVALMPLTITVRAPVVAPSGTEVVM